MELRTNATMSGRQAIVDSMRAHDSRCWGCESTGTFCMVSGTVMSDPRKDGAPEFYDLFCTREQAETLLKDLQKILGKESVNENHLDRG